VRDELSVAVHIVIRHRERCARALREVKRKVEESHFIIIIANMEKKTVKCLYFTHY